MSEKFINVHHESNYYTCALWVLMRLIDAGQLSCQVTDLRGSYHKDLMINLNDDHSSDQSESYTISPKSGKTGEFCCYVIAYTQVFSYMYVMHRCVYKLYNCM